LLQLGSNALLLFVVQGLQHGAPELGLPALLCLNLCLGSIGQNQVVLALRPRLKPVGTVVLVLIEQIGQFGSQLQHSVRLIALQKSSHRGKVGMGGERWQQLHQAPNHGNFVQWRLTRHGLTPEHLAVGTPQGTVMAIQPAWQRKRHPCEPSPS
jgi:hypothetical protein